jgi:hypothetical protein
VRKNSEVIETLAFITSPSFLASESQLHIVFKIAPAGMPFERWTIQLQK